MVATALKAETYSHFILKNYDTNEISIEVNGLYLFFKKDEAQIKITAHPLGDGIRDNTFGTIYAPLDGGENSIPITRERNFTDIQLHENLNMSQATNPKDYPTLKPTNL